MLLRNDLPKLGSDLISTLPYLDINYFPHIIITIEQ